MAQSSASQDPFGVGENGVEETKKTKKRITFKLDYEEDGGDSYDSDSSVGRRKKGSRASSSGSRLTNGLDGDYSDIDGVQRNRRGREGDSLRTSRGEDGGSLTDVSRSARKGGRGHDQRGGLESADGGSGSWEEKDPTSRGSRNRHSGGRDHHDNDGGGDEGAFVGSGGSRFRSRRGARDRLGGGDDDKLRIKLGGEDAQGTSSQDRLGTGLEQSGSRSRLAASGDHHSSGKFYHIDLVSILFYSCLISAPTKLITYY